MYLNNLLGATALGFLVLAESCGGGDGKKTGPIHATLTPQNLQFIVPGAKVISFQVDFVTSVYTNPCKGTSGPLMSTNDGTENIAQCTVLVPADGQIFYDAQITLKTAVPSQSTMHVRSCGTC